MDFRQLETFVEVAKAKSFSEAGKKLYLTQPTVTNHIQNLEKELGTLLLNRCGKKVSLTEAGTILFKYAIDIINMRDMAQFDLGMYKGKIEGHLKISSSSIPKHYVLPYILKEFTKKYPHVTFSLTSRDSKDVVESILNNYTDFGIIGAKYESRQLEYIDLIEDNIVIVTPNNDNYPWEIGKKLDKDFLLNQNIIMREKGSGTRLLVEKVFKENNIDLNSLNIKACIEDIETIKKFVELDLGISFISERAVKKEVNQGILKTFKIKNLNLSRKFYFVYHKNRQLSPLAKAFKEFVIEYI
ncbi:selenium metabolism-associated LysR family transcriptional regulator [Thermohalobacter berrensis]|uniref:LysR family transcriptional regulator n=1 Tax=Thermohalobacter berrensis TaxID=99594 RepID=A0A419T6G4_9FIRM|nr:selenium metabolism-associated LysR family transcriptional regulator [Thermohalobacter berrensis]RKD33154.1 LysR family transcriptional regulator [Thermohalobacter berrensis]